MKRQEVIDYRETGKLSDRVDIKKYGQLSLKLPQVEPDRRRNFFRISQTMCDPEIMNDGAKVAEGYQSIARLLIDVSVIANNAIFSYQSRRNTTREWPTLFAKGIQTHNQLTCDIRSAKC